MVSIEAPNGQLSETFQQHMDMELNFFLDHEREVAQNLRNGGATEENIQHLFHVHLYDFIGEVFTPRWQQQLEQLGLSRH